MQVNVLTALAQAIKHMLCQAQVLRSSDLKPLAELTIFGGAWATRSLETAKTPYWTGHGDRDSFSFGKPNGPNSFYKYDVFKEKHVL